MAPQEKRVLQAGYSEPLAVGVEVVARVAVGGRAIRVGTAARVAHGCQAIRVVTAAGLGCRRPVQKLPKWNAPPPRARASTRRAVRIMEPSFPGMETASGQPLTKGQKKAPLDQCASLPESGQATERRNPWTCSKPRPWKPSACGCGPSAGATSTPMPRCTRTPRSCATWEREPSPGTGAGPRGTWPSSWGTGSSVVAANGPSSGGRTEPSSEQSAFPRPRAGPAVELAWILARRFWGYGYATEAARAALCCGFLDWRKDRIISLIHPENRASIRVAQRLGESLEGRIHHFGREMLCYGIDRETYLTQVAPLAVCA